MKKILAIGLALLMGLLFTFSVAEEAGVMPGDLVTFGAYPQTEEGGDRTPVEWIVLDVQDGKALLLSRYALEKSAYHAEEGDVTWEQSTLRAWLNNDFLGAAFSEDEQAAILLTDVDNSAAQGYSAWETDGGSGTQDKIFLLSYAEAKKYFGSDYGTESEAARAAATLYLAAQDPYISDEYTTAEGEPAVWWWLRSPGTKQDSATTVGGDGAFSYYVATNNDAGVRPALWIDLTAVK